MAERGSTRTERSKLAAASNAVCAHDAGRPAHRERGTGSGHDAGHFPDRRIARFIQPTESGVAGQADVPDRRGRPSWHCRDVAFGFGYAATFSIRIDE